MDLAKVLKDERKRRGWTQRDLAKTLGVTPSAVAQWELGDTRPSFARMVDLCSAFGLAVSSFLGPGSPYAGQLIESPDELALIEHFRRVPAAERGVILRMVRNASAGPGDGDMPQRRR